MSELKLASPEFGEHTMYPLKLKLIVDFYLLERASSISPQYGRRPQEQAHARVKELFTDLSETLANAFHDYLFLAAVGEARHAKANTDGSAWYFADLPAVGGARNAAMIAGLEYDPLLTAQLLERLFNQDAWPPNYGGKAWGRIAKAVTMFYELPHAVFVDHVIDIEHNGGNAFNKIEGLSIVGIDASKTMTAGMTLTEFLDWKAQHDILYDWPPIIPPAAIKLTGHEIPDDIQVCKRTYYALKKWYRVFHNRAMPAWIGRHETRWPTYTPQHFGSKVPSIMVSKQLERIKDYAEQQVPAIEPEEILDNKDTIIYTGKELQIDLQNTPQDEMPSEKLAYLT